MPTTHEATRPTPPARQQPTAFRLLKFPAPAKTADATTPNGKQLLDAVRVLEANGRDICLGILARIASDLAAKGGA